MRLAVVGHVIVDLVRHHRDVGKPLEAGDQLVDLAPRCHPAGRIGRRVHDQQPRPRRDQPERLLGGERKAVLLADRHRNRPRPGILDHRAIDRKTGIGIEDVGARLAEHQDRHEHRRLAAGQDHHLVGRDAHREALVQVGGDRLAQRRDPDRRGVAVMAVAQRLDGRLDDELGSAEIGLADAEVDDVAALRGKLGGARQHGEGVLLADAIERRDGPKHPSLPGIPRCPTTGRFCAGVQRIPGGKATKPAEPHPNR